MELVEGLLEACSSGDPVIVSSYLQQSNQYGIDLNFITNEGLTLLTHTIIAAGIYIYIYIYIYLSIYLYLCFHLISLCTQLHKFYVVDFHSK